MAIAETWMPVSGRFRNYPLQVTLWHWEDGPVIWSKGHHDPDLFLVAAVQKWAEEDDLSLTMWDDQPGRSTLLRCEGPIWPPSWLRNASRVRHEWWANRMHAILVDEGYKFFVEPGSPARRGAYPVTVVEL